jgi:hypothetical protein
MPSLEASHEKRRYEESRPSVRLTLNVTYGYFSIPSKMYPASRGSTLLLELRIGQSYDTNAV